MCDKQLGLISSYTLPTHPYITLQHATVNALNLFSRLVYFKVHEGHSVAVLPVPGTPLVLASFRVMLHGLQAHTAVLL